jgi:hypothetical protein
MKWVSLFLKMGSNPFVACAFSLLYEDFQISVFKRRLSSSASYIHLVAGFLL